MKHRWLIIVGLLVVLTCIAAAVAFAHPREPEYGGKTLSQWLVVWGSPAYPQSMLPAEEAVRQIGTNALPWLLDWVQYEEPAWRGKARQCMAKLPRKLQIQSVMQACNPCRPNRPDVMAYRAFRILGAQAAPAVPELARLARLRTKPMDVRGRALACLELVDGSTSPTFRQALADCPELAGYVRPQTVQPAPAAAWSWGN